MNMLHNNQAEQGKQDNGELGAPGKGPSDTYQTIKPQRRYRKIGWYMILPKSIYMHRFIFTVIHTYCSYIHFLSLCVCPGGKEYIHIQWNDRHRQKPFRAILSFQPTAESSGHYDLVMNLGFTSYSGCCPFSCRIQSEKAKEYCLPIGRTFSKAYDKVLSLRCSVCQSSYVACARSDFQFQVLQRWSGESFICAHCHLFISSQSDLLCEAWEVINQSPSGH